MKKILILLSSLLVVSLPVLHAADTLTLAVDSSAFVFSPGNWTGNEGRVGKTFRQTWNPGAYFRVAWESSNPKPAAKILLDTSTYSPNFKPPQIAYSIDGVWKSTIPCTNEVVINEATGTGRHELSVFLGESQQVNRWGSEGQSGLNVLRVTGVQIDAASKPLPATLKSKWALIVGDSITEGSGASELAGYSFLVGLALQTQGYEYCISACGWNGWLQQGDSPADVPGYYIIRSSLNGFGGQYDDGASRWNKIDGNHHSLLDSRGHISSGGGTGQEPSLILINLGTNDSLHGSNPGDTLASITQSLAALQKAAPEAQIIIIIPFGQYCATELKNAVKTHNRNHPANTKVAVIDLGPATAKALASAGMMGVLHPNDRGSAYIAAKIIPQVITILNPALK